MTLKQLAQKTDGEKIAVFETDLGRIKFRLFPEAAPKAVENFIGHIQEGYYDGILFHRVIDGFMIQGGDPTGTGMGGESIWGKPFEDEFHTDYRNFRGALSMANAGPRTNGSQFFIVQGSAIDPHIIRQMRALGSEGGYPDQVVEAYENLGGAYWLDGKHTVFGQVLEGMDVVDDIAASSVDAQNRPMKEIKIKKAYMED